MEKYLIQRNFFTEHIFHFNLDEQENISTKKRSTRNRIHSYIDFFSILERKLDVRDIFPVDDRLIFYNPILTNCGYFPCLLKGNFKDINNNVSRRKYSGGRKLQFHKLKLKEKFCLENNIYQSIYFRQFSVSSIDQGQEFSLEYDDKAMNDRAEDKSSSLSNLLDLTSENRDYLFQEKNGGPSSMSRDLEEEKLSSTLCDDVNVMKNKTSSAGEDNKSRLTHIDEKGAANMVDVGGKNVSKRQAIARSVLWVGEEAGTLILENNVKKGDVFGVARIAGIMSAKSTASLIPLCHQVPLSSVKVDFKLDTNSWEVVITATALCEGKTGVEMEALVAASISALTVYDMVKSVAGRSGMAIKEVRLISKVGGQKGDYLYEG